MHSKGLPGNNRLESLDILRGADLFLLVFLQPVIIAVAGVIDMPWADRITYNFDHEVWVGFRLWDLVMPLFLFMVGAAMPLSFGKYLSGQGNRKRLYKRIGRRVIILFLLGMIVQGNLLSINPDRIYFYNNTLQAIAAGYLIASVIILNFKLRTQVALTGIILIAYTAPMLAAGDWTATGNFAYGIDRAIIGMRTDDLTYTWIWSSLTFSVTVMMGSFATAIIRREPGKAVVRLTLIGLTCIAAGLAISPVIPIIKRIWTSSMTLYSGGICFLLLALFYYWIDCKGHSCGLKWLKIYGMNAITAYVIGEVINFRSIVESVSFGLRPLIGDAWYGAWLTFGNFSIVFLILAFMYRHRIFIRV